MAKKREEKGGQGSACLAGFGALRFSCELLAGKGLRRVTGLQKAGAVVGTPKWALCANTCYGVSEVSAKPVFEGALAGAVGNGIGHLH